MNTLSSLLSFIGSFEPIGSVKMYAGESQPSKWLICDGSAVSRNTYAKLFAVIGTRYGAGDGVNTFNLPDFSGRTAIGVATTHELAETGGSETVTLTDAQIAHGHSFTNPTYKATGGAVAEKAAFNTGGMSANATHTHKDGVNENSKFAASAGNATCQVLGDKSSSSARETTSANLAHTHQVPAHTHSFTQPTISVNSNGSVANLHGASSTRTAHSNMQPYLAVNYIIFAGK